MARKPRLHVPGGLYHLISRGNNRQDIFVDREDRVTFLNFLFQYAGEMELAVFAYVLMTNLVHLLVEASDLPVAELMRRLLARYTQGVNGVNVEY